MSRDKDVKSTELKYGAGGVGLGGLSAGLQAIAQPGGAFTPFIETVATPGMVLGGALLAGAVAHNRWYFAERQKFRREISGDGWVTRYDLRETCGKAALKKIGRPGWRIGKVASGHRNVRGKSVFSVSPRAAAILGPQGSGKSQLLIHPVIDSPGAQVVSSTKTELAEETAVLRSQIGPVLIFNPQSLGDLGNTFFWDPVSGCENQQVAESRAWALVRGGGGAEGTERADFWARKAQEIIRCYLMAAAIQGWDMGAVAHWANNPDDLTPVNILEAHPQHAPAGWVGTLMTAIQASHNTRTGYYATVTSCVGFMDNPTVAMACRPRPDQQFNVADFIASRGTLYLVGGGDDHRIAPLLTALTEHVFSEAKSIASRLPDGRLDPHLSFWLDEAANITPVPLDKWASDSRGWGIQVTAVFQDKSQIETTWGPSKADTIWANLVTKVVLTGLTNQRDLEDLSYLGRTRQVKQISEGENIGGHGKSVSTNRTYRTEKVIEGHTIANMLMWHAYVIGVARRPVVVKYEPGSDRAKRLLRKLGKASKARQLPGLAWRSDEGEDDTVTSAA
jgi:type IV secretory pathway TraG/TraD family ATPase VirD4